ncbi:MAG: hypothetical protein H7Z19_20840 [Chitinophagaceae bacterium]|nr:hypothetical protein [Rubrivivax sp.]
MAPKPWHSPWAAGWPNNREERTMPPTIEQRKWVHDVLQVIKLSDRQEIEETQRKDSLRGDIGAGVQKIDHQVSLMTEAVDHFFDAYRQGLLTFGMAMLDAEMDDKEASTAADIVFKIFMTLAAMAFPEVDLAKALGKILIARIGEAGEKLSEKAASSIKEITMDVLEKGRDRVKGAPTPSARVFRDFAKALGDASVADKSAMRVSVLQGGKSVKEAFSQMATAAGTTEGPATKFIQLMLTASQSFIDRLKALSDPNQLEAEFATHFAGKAGQTPRRTSLLDSTRDAGTLYFEITTVTNMRAAKPDFTLGDDTDEKWKLVMLGDKRDAEGAARTLKESVKTPWKIQLPRKIRIDVYNEVNKRDHNMCGGWLVFNKGNTSANPNSFEGVTGSYGGWDTGRKPQEWLMLAWGHATIQAAAIANEDLEGAVD